MAGKKKVAAVAKLHTKFNNIETEMKTFFVERDEVVHGLTLAILSENNILLLGPPGVAKSMAVRAWKDHIDLGMGAEEAKYFEWLLTKFSTPEEIFGPYSIKALSEEDRYSRITTDKLPEAHLGFMDEIFKCNSGLLNSLLPVLNEKKFHNDGKAHDIPLLAVVGASNEIPDSEDGLEALFDRFLLKFMVKPIQEESNFKQMITTNVTAPATMVSLQEIHEAKAEVDAIEINSGMADLLIKIRRTIKAQGLAPTDRTYKTAIRILKAEAWLNGRDELVEDDFNVLRHVLWTDPKDERPVWSVILDLVNPEKGKIISLYEDAIEVANQTLKEKNSHKRIEKGIDTTTKLKEIKKKIGVLVKQMDAKKKDTKEAKEYDQKVTVLLNRVFTESIGVDMSDLG